MTLPYQTGPARAYYRLMAEYCSLRHGLSTAPPSTGLRALLISLLPLNPSHEPPGPALRAKTGRSRLLIEELFRY
jgi:hypothetical protein